MRRKPQPTKTTRNRQPQSLLDLNRSLPGFAYKPAERASNAPRPAVALPKAPTGRARWKRVVLWTLSLLLGVFLATGGWIGWKFVSNEVRIFGWQGLMGLFHSQKLDGESSGHVTILLAGNSADDSGHNGANLTDSIMLLSLNTQTNTAFMLSIPRDLYVAIPGHDYAKINEAYQDGESDHFSDSGYAPGGMGLLEKTVAQQFGIEVQYYALVDYSAVRDAVNAVGGIDVTVASSDPRGLYDPSPDYGNNSQPLVNLSNGVRHINGVQALGLARARGDSYRSYGYALSDFTRTANQRQIMLGLKDRATGLGTLSNPVKLGQLFDSVGGNVKTDLTLGNVHRLYDLLKKIPSSSIVSASLNGASDHSDLLKNYTTPYGQSALIPRAGLDNYTDIQTFLTQLLNPPAPTSPKAQ